MAIKGMTVVLIDKVKTGTDPFDAPIYEDKEIPIENVLVSPTSSDDVINQVQLYGKKSTYTLGIPKGDEHDWEDKEVHFWGKKYRTFGPIIEGIESMVPSKWHKKVMVERYE